MAISPIGLVVGAALARDIQDRGRASQIQILGGVMGTSPMGLVLLATLANDAKDAKPSRPGDPTKPASPAEAAVPDVRDAGSDLAAAGGILKAHGLAAGQPRSVISEAPQDEIIGSEPRIGTLVPLATEVSIFVSAGLVVPTVTGKLRADAEADLETAGFRTSVQDIDGPGKPDTVKKQDPAAGDLASSGDVVTLFVIEAPPDEYGRASKSAAEEELTTLQPS
jgi:serine/threonine-protein kinase